MRSITLLLFFFFLFFNNPEVQANTAFSCLKAITDNPELNNNAHHPEYYYFAKNSAQTNQFFLIQEKKSYLCQTDSNLNYDASIDILTAIPNLNIPRRLFYFLSAVPREKPQTKSKSIPIEDGFLPRHVAMPSAIELATTPTRKKIVAQCAQIRDEELIAQQLVQLARNEIEDVYADFADHRDALSYNYDLKENDKKKNRNQFDLKLKKILELCAEVPELKSVVATVSRKINLKSDVRINIPASLQPLSRKKDKLPSGVKQ